MNEQADPLSLPTLRVSSFVTLLHVFQKAKEGVLPTTLDDKELNVLRAYADLAFDEDHVGVNRCVGAHAKSTGCCCCCWWWW
jgi:hypothetical protein